MFWINSVQFGVIFHVMDVIFVYSNDSNCVFVYILSKKVVCLLKLIGWMQLLIMLLERNGQTQPNHTIQIIKCKKFRTTPRRLSLTVSIRIRHSITKTRINSKNKKYLVAYYCAKIRNNDTKTLFIMDMIVDCHISQNLNQTVNKSTIDHRISIVTATELSNNINGLSDINDIAPVNVNISATAKMNRTSAPASALEREELKRREIGLETIILIAE